MWVCVWVGVGGCGCVRACVRACMHACIIFNVSSPATEAEYINNNNYDTILTAPTRSLRSAGQRYVDNTAVPLSDTVGDRSRLEQCTLCLRY